MFVYLVFKFTAFVKVGSFPFQSFFFFLVFYKALGWEFDKDISSSSFSPDLSTGNIHLLYEPFFDTCFIIFCLTLLLHYMRAMTVFFFILNQD